MKFGMPWLAVAMATSVLSAKPPVPSFTTTSSGLQFVDLRPGTGKTPAAGQTCAVLYRGWLYADKKRGKLFDSAQDPRKPFRFQIGQGQVIPGWDEGVATMKAGGKRALIVPPALGYGDQGSGDAIPPNATLLFEVELLSVK
jgi:peptidylprolyl isomerase